MGKGTGTYFIFRFSTNHWFQHHHLPSTASGASSNWSFLWFYRKWAFSFMTSSYTGMEGFSFFYFIKVIYHSSLWSITTGPLLSLFLIYVDSYFSYSFSVILVGPWKETAINKSVQCEFKKKSSSIAWIKYCVTFYSKVFWHAIFSLEKALSPSLPPGYSCTWCSRLNCIPQKMCPSQYLWMWFYLE